MKLSQSATSADNRDIDERSGPAGELGTAVGGGRKYGKNSELESTDT